MNPSAPPSVGGSGSSPGAGANDGPDTNAPLAAGLTGTVNGVSVGDPSTIRFAATGGKAPYAFTSTDAPPTGLTLQADGSLSGTFGYAGSYAMTVTVTDASNATKTVPLAIDVRPTAPSVALTLPVNGGKALVAGFPFSAQATAGMGNSLSWSLPVQPFALGVTSGGLISGTIPDQTQSFAFTVRGTDAFNRSADAASGTLSVQQPTLTPDTPSLSVQEGSFGAFQAVTNLPSPVFSVVSGPAGASVGTNGVVNVYGGDVSADQNSTVRVMAKSGTVSLTSDVALTVQAASVSIGPIPDLRPGQSFDFPISTTMTHAGGWTRSSTPSDVVMTQPPPSRTWTINLVAPANTGTAPQSRTVNFTYTGSDAPAGATPASATASTSFSVYPALAFATAPAAIGAVPGVTVNRAAPSVNGQAGALTYKLFSAGSEIPAGVIGACTGLSFATTGTISGTPTKACSLPSLTLRVTDAGVGTLGATTADSATFAISVASTLSMGTQPSATTVNQGSAATTGAAYSGTPYGATTWDVLDQTGAVASLPAWITKAAGTCGTSSTGCTLQAAPTVSTTPGTYPATGGYKIRVTDASGTAVTSNAFAFTVKQTPVTASIATTSYNVTVGDTATTAPVTTAGGSTPYAYSVVTTSGTAPAVPGSFAANGAYTFTPDSASVGTWVFKIRATSAGDATNSGDTAAVNVNIAALAVSSIPPQTAYSAQNFSYTAKTNSTGTASWSATGLPTGLGIGATTGVISGSTSVANGAYPVTVTASLRGTTVSTSFTLTVSPPPSANINSYKAALNNAGWDITFTQCAPCGSTIWTYDSYMSLSSRYGAPTGWGLAYDGGSYAGNYINPPMKDTNTSMGGIITAQNSFGPPTNSKTDAGGDYSAPSGTQYRIIFFDYTNTSSPNQYAYTIKKR